MTVPIYMALLRLDRNGLFFIHATTVCRFHEMMSRMAVEDKYHPQNGGSKNVKKPFGMARRSL